MSTPNFPIENAGTLYVNGLQLSWLSNTTLGVGIGRARNSSNINDIILSAQQGPLVLNAANVGANGLDTGVLAINTHYAIYIIGDSTLYQPTACIASANVLAPNLPGGYDMYRLIGWASTAGAAQFRSFFQYGLDQTRTYYYEFGVAVLGAGGATTMTAVDCSPGVPPIRSEVNLLTTYTAVLATSSAQFLPFGAVATDGTIRIGTGVAAAQMLNVIVPTQLNVSAPTLLYKVFAGDVLNLVVVGYTHYIA